MPFLENLVEGFAGAVNDPNTVNRIEGRKADRRATAHEELQANTQSILDDVGKLQERRAALPAGSPEIANIDKQLAAHQQAFTDLYHPVKNPDNFQKLGGFLKQHITGKAPKPAPQSNAVTPERMAQLRAGAAGTMPPDPYLTPDELKHKARIAAGIEQRAGTERTDQENWVPTPLILPDGKQVTWQRNSKSGAWTDLSGQPIPPELLRSASIPPKAAAGSNSKFAQEASVFENKWGKKLKDWTPEELSYFNQKMAYDSQHSGSSTTTRLEKDENGVIHPVEFTSTRGPIRPPVDPHEAKAAPTTPGAAKQRAQSVAPRSSVREGAPLSFKAGTPAVTKARNDVTEATKLSSVADQVQQKPNDAVNQKRLAVALERASAGRFTTQALDYIIKAGWGNTMEQWANNPSTGALPADIVRQLVDGAHENLKGAQDALKAAEGGGDTGATSPQATGKAVSLAAAKKLPSMQGKTDDQIRQAIQAAGHTVAP
jgi:hypothetical protein